MRTENHDLVQAINAKEIVMSCINALNEEDFDKARKFVNENMRFIGVLGSRNGAEEYFADMRKMKLKYHIKKVFENGDDVCLLYDLDISGISIFGCGWYHVRNGKIDTLQVVFDPRPILESSRKN